MLATLVDDFPNRIKLTMDDPAVASRRHDPHLLFGLHRQLGTQLGLEIVRAREQLPPIVLGRHWAVSPFQASLRIELARAARSFELFGASMGTYLHEVRQESFWASWSARHELTCGLGFTE